MSILLLLLCSNTLLFQDTSQLSLISSMSSHSSSPILPSTSMRYTMPAVVGTTEQFSTAGLSGFHSVKLNKACHILYGNRRNLGYRLAEWNCARGLLTCHSEDSDKLVDRVGPIYRLADIFGRYRNRYIGIGKLDIGIGLSVSVSVIG